MVRRPRSLVTFGLVLAVAIPVGPAAAVSSRGASGSDAGASAAGSATAGIPLVTRIVQGRPKGEAQAQAFSDAYQFAEDHPSDVSYPWIDPKRGDIELSAATAHGRDVLNASRAELKAARVRDVTRSFGELEAIKHEITTLRAQGVPDADLIFQTAPDHKSNRIVISVTEPSERLFKALAARYGTEAIAVMIDPDGAGATPGATRQTDFSPYWGGAKITTPQYGCSDAFAWYSGTTGDAMLTAAHCIPTGGNVNIGQQTNSGTVLSQGHENWDAEHGTQFYTGQSVYRGDVALINLASTRASAAYIYRGGANSSSFSGVVSWLQRNSVNGDVFYVGGATTGETGPYTVDFTGIDVIYDPPSDKWVRNITSAARGTFDTCANHGDSGGSVFAKVSGGVRAAGVFSGFFVCRIYFTDIYKSYLGLPGSPKVQ